MATPRAVKIPRTPALPHAVRLPAVRTDRSAPPVGVGHERRVNVAGTQRAVRLSLVFVVALVAIYAGFVLYDRTTPGGTAPAQGNGVLLFTGLFLLFAIGGVIVTLTPAPRAIEIREDAVTVVGRWGRRRRLSSLGLLSVAVVRKYPEGLLASGPVAMVEVYGEDMPRRSYLVEEDLFAGANPLPKRT
ncbi:MAG TPA: hypothetical protein VK423_05520 [Thermoplasmata archaeon]|nr:hypothetical protein [Thermoplasmata archaeon]